MAKVLKDPGVGYKSNSNAQRIIVDGKSNVRHINKPKSIDDLYTYLIEISWGLFLTYVLIGYIVMNIGFAFFYFFIGAADFFAPSGSFWLDFVNLFFFSAQTLTTVGYGAVAPSGVLAGFVSSFEALIGLTSFSFITGLMYGRFSKPKAKIKFSDHLIIRNFDDSRAMMFRVMNKRTNLMIEPELNAVINITEKGENGEFKRAFYQLQLERNKIMYLPTMWTLVHKMNEDSPLFKYTEDELQNLEAEIYILFKYHEEAFNQNLYQLHSYNFEQLKIGYQFGSSYAFDEEGFTIVDHDQLNYLEKI
ncbi:ion channel [Wenyingzhuangia sp. 2_MG-2023]|uniref:ion channel n=1 Tax=Wenyingzhuangia sp. 2_MG-2023 TaxID=3062639 RepID=UPI0026E3F7AF|nr:ion channel [Wenyingzhuangia sp. 2_MG-2023]MDO6738396.1 ion channel [Wenyingzhuangia sp. 2_MG-2023]MDO6803381.1 ion channel [Wenyingzhuangia sp. 1_MG-2023]